jgi:hypothetical protein
MELCVVLSAEEREKKQNGGEIIMERGSTSHNPELHITLSPVG